MTAPLLDIAGLEVRYGGVAAVRGIGLAIGPCRSVALLGANGAGKSTVMKAIIGLLPTGDGSIRFDGRPIDRLRPDQRARLGIGYCPEGRRIFPGMTVRENLLAASWEGAAARTSRIAEMVALFPILGTRHASRAWELSGGQQQMLAIARSLMNRPRLLLLDEPSLGLSPKLVGEVMRLIPEIVASGVSVLLAEQNASRALAVCDEAVLLRVGRVVRSGRSAELADSPDIAAAFLGG